MSHLQYTGTMLSNGHSAMACLELTSILLSRGFLCSSASSVAAQCCSVASSLWLCSGTTRSLWCHTVSSMAGLKVVM